MNSLPVAFGTETAKWITVATIDITQLSVAAYLAFGLDQKLYGTVLLGLVLPQVRCLINKQSSGLILDGTCELP